MQILVKYNVQEKLQLLLDFSERSDLSTEQLIQIAEVICSYSHDWTEEKRRGTQLLLTCTERIDLTREQLVHIAKTLYQYSYQKSEEEH